MATYKTAEEAIEALTEELGNRYQVAQFLGIDDGHLYLLATRGPSPTLVRALRRRGLLSSKRRRLSIPKDNPESAARSIWRHLAPDDVQHLVDLLRDRLESLS